jgi:hypothetical protein
MSYKYKTINLMGYTVITPVFLTFFQQNKSSLIFKEENQIKTFKISQKIKLMTKSFLIFSTRKFNQICSVIKIALK